LLRKLGLNRRRAPLSCLVFLFHAIQNGAAFAARRSCRARWRLAEEIDLNLRVDAVQPSFGTVGSFLISGDFRL
jgi:hypothetical protein